VKGGVGQNERGRHEYMYINNWKLHGLGYARWEGEQMKLEFNFN
jgi:hypothetical protein